MYYLLILLGLLLNCNDAVTTMPVAEISVITDKESYRVQEEIVVTIENGLDTPITSQDQRTYCSIIILEQQLAAGWQPVNNCTANAPGQEVTIHPDSVATVTLIPNQLSDGIITSGTYRATLLYTTGPSFRPAQTSTASSAEFLVR